MNARKLMNIGIIIVVIDLLVGIFFPSIYRDAMERKYKDSITTKEATVTLVTFTSEYHSGAKGSRGTMHYIYKILANSDGEIIELIDHDVVRDKIQIERNDVITVYCLDDKYAYDPEDYYKMSSLVKALAMSPLFVGLGFVFVGSILKKKEY